jgi:anti-sigma B factor antagonist
MNHTRLDEGAKTILQVRGELDALSATELRPALDKIIADGRRDVQVDLSGLRLIDSSGVGALVSLYKRVRALGGDVEFIGVTGQPLVVFKLLRLDVVFELPVEAPLLQEAEAAAANPDWTEVPSTLRVRN